MEPVLNIAIKAAREAGRVILHHLDALDSVAVTEKSLNDFVTEVDLKSEQILIQSIQKMLPNHAILSEETGHIGDSEEFLWIIDPLDGTRNFMHGFPHFAISMALKVKGKMEYGVVYDPVRQEIFCATRGKGARLNDRRIRVSDQKKLAHSMLGTGFPHSDPALVERYLPTFNALFANVAAIRRAGAAALDLAYVAAGRLDGFWECRLQPWDIAAGSLLIKEAGGLVTDFKGTEKYMDSGNIVAANAKLLKPLLQMIGPHLS